MRPVQKNEWPIENGVNKVYRKYQHAKQDLMDNLGDFCSYCEVFGSKSHLEVEHIFPKSNPRYAHLEKDWTNFLLACKNCNTIKSTTVVDPANAYLPHQNNTYLALSFSEGGVVTVNPTLDKDQKIRAQNLIELVGLDRVPGHDDYSPKDNRWNLRRTQWDLAQKYLLQYESGSTTAGTIVDLAIQRGFFSIWMTVFQKHPPVKTLLVAHFLGTSANSFDADGNAILRNITDL